MPYVRATMKSSNWVMVSCPACECASVGAAGIGRSTFVTRRVNDAGSMSATTYRLRRLGSARRHLNRRLSRGPTRLVSVAMPGGGSGTLKAGIGTFGSVINAYFDGDGASLRTMGEQRARIRSTYSSSTSTDPQLKITVQELQLAADAHPSASSASRAITYLKPLARWAAKRGLMQRGFSELEKPDERNVEDGGHTVLDRDTLALVLPALDQGHHGPAARLMLWTAARLDEVCSATWSEFDLDTGLWTVAAGRRKDTRSRARKKQVQAQPHVIPLPRQAISMLVPMGKGKTPGDLVFPNAHGGKLDNWDRWSKSIFERTGTSGWTRHDLRRTCATLAADLNVAPHIISIMLGHKTPENNHLLGIYSKGRYRQQHGEALQAVADLLDTYKNARISHIGSISDE